MIVPWPKSWSMVQISVALTPTLCAATSMSPSRSSSRPYKPGFSLRGRAGGAASASARCSRTCNRSRPDTPARRRTRTHRSLDCSPCIVFWWWRCSRLFLQRRRNVLLQEQADEATVRGGDRRALELVIDHLVQHLMEGDERPERARRRPHSLLDQKLRIFLQLFGTKQAEHHPRVVDDDDRVPTLCTNPRLHIAELLRQGARSNIFACDVA